MNKIVITSALRTAVRSLNKSLKNVPAHEMGASVIKSLLKKSKVKNQDVDEDNFGPSSNRGSTGQNPARQASINSGLPKEKPAYVVNQVCGSGLRSIASGFQSIIIRMTQKL